LSLGTASVRIDARPACSNVRPGYGPHRRTYRNDHARAEQQADAYSQAAEETRGHIAHGDEVARAEAGRPAGQVEVEPDALAGLLRHGLLQHPAEALDRRPQDAIREV